MSGQSDSMADRLLTSLRSIAGKSDRLVSILHVPGREERLEEWPAWVPQKIVDHYRALGIEKPWSHQVEAANAAHEGWHTVISTGTGSGKSMAAWLPILADIEGGTGTRLSQIKRRPTALYLAPTKALAADQLQHLQGVINASSTPLAARLGTADGDTPREAKDWARGFADVILTNPDYLHHVMLPGHERWSRVLSGLRYIVIDEMHYWRGVTGAHISLVLRRLLRVARHLGADPTVIFLSATVAEAPKAAARLIGVHEAEVVSVTEDGSPAGAKELILWQPALLAPRDMPIEEFLAALEAEEPKILLAEMQRRSATSEAAILTAELVQQGAKLLTFVRSRAASESVAAKARDTLSMKAPQYMSKVASYRGGYLPEERRALETSLRTGAVTALATTNALELGVDVSGLDATITAGWPGTRASLWQQVGRAGRAGGHGVSVLIASDNPLDAYLIHNPEMILEPVEATTFDPANPYVLTPHLAAAASEMPLTEADVSLFGLDSTDAFDALARQGYLRRRPTGWYWNVALPMRAQDLTELRGSSMEVQVVEEATGTVIGTVASDQASAQVHPGAIYVHQGRTYQVTELTREPSVAAGVLQGTGSGATSAGTAGTRIALVRPVVTDLRTRPTVQSRVQILNESETWSDELVSWSFGEVEVASQVTDFDTLRLPGLQFVSNTKLDMPVQKLLTMSVWWQIDEAAAVRLGIPAADLPGALHAAEHASIGILPLLATCDRWDLGGLSTADHEQTLRPTVFVHDAYPGGAGFAEHAWRHASDWVAATLGVIESCPCEDGCPSCIQSPKCGNRNEPLSKAGAIKLLRFLGKHTPSEADTALQAD
ncbi:MAG: DEAD/DEAH box helicase [Actinomycetaceae bacterium]|nr:DEAD/DEAH box helicase [Actinomycetaceae bacterium]